MVDLGQLPTLEQNAAAVAVYCSSCHLVCSDDVPGGLGACTVKDAAWIHETVGMYCFAVIEDFHYDT